MHNYDCDCDNNCDNNFHAMIITLWVRNFDWDYCDLDNKGIQTWVLSDFT